MRLLGLVHLLLLFECVQDHLKELRTRAKNAVAKRAAKRIAKYKERLTENLPSQIDVWNKRETRLLNLITGKSGVSIAALLVRECPDPPKEIDPDTDDDESKHEDKVEDKEIGKQVEEIDPTIRNWTQNDIASTQALDISEKQRVILQQKAMAMAQYCSAMKSRASAMLRFIKQECPLQRGDVMTLFRAKYPHYGLRWITRDVCEKLCKLLVCARTTLLFPIPHVHHHHTIHPGIKDADTFTRWRKYYMTNGCFMPDRRGRHTAGFLLRHDDLKLELTQWLLGRLKRDINVSDVRHCFITNTHMHTTHTN